MNKFLMICYVAADFGPFEGEMFRVTPNMISTFIEAPEWIKDTIMFKWLLADGSIKVAEQQITKKQGENDPLAGMAADGKDAKVSEAQEAEIEKKTAPEVAAAEETEAPKAEETEAEKQTKVETAAKKPAKTAKAKKDDAK